MKVDIFRTTSAERARRDKERRDRAAAWVTYCAQSWPDLPRDLVERLAPKCPTIYHLRQRALEALGLTGEHCP